MEKVRLWCGQPSDRGRLKNRTEQNRSGSVNFLCEMLISWGNVWLTDRRSLFKRLIGVDLVWGHELWPDVDILDTWHSPMFYNCKASLIHTFSYDVSFNVRDNGDDVNWRWSVYVYACCVSRGIIKILFKRDWRLWYHFVSNYLEYTCAGNYQNSIEFGSAKLL